MAFTCPHRGASYPDEERCRDRFHACLALEYEQPAVFGAVHHLLVLCYMLQHNEYAPESWLGSRALLARFVAEGLRPEDARLAMRATAASNRRTWSVTLGEKLAAVDDIRWSRTIADVRLDTADHYVADVRQWAASVVADTAPLMRDIEDSMQCGKVCGGLADTSRRRDSGLHPGLQSQVEPPTPTMGT